MRAIFVCVVALAIVDGGAGSGASLPTALAAGDGGAPAAYVKLKLDVYPKSAKAIVTWGAKKLGPPPIELERPRGSGPIDLVIKADGYLDHHTRLFTDRNDRLSVTLRPVGGRPSGPPATDAVTP